MTTEKMTVHKALAELKIVDDRIVSAINSGTYCIANKHSNDKIKGVSLDEYKKTMRWKVYVPCLVRNPEISSLQ